MRNSYEDFDEFIEWLKRDGLKPKTSERLWRKKIFSNLQHGHKKSLVNYEDFQFYKKLNSLLKKDVLYKDIKSSIAEVNIEHLDCVLVMQDRHKLRIKLDDLNSFIDTYIKKGK
jgi:hypothetical protein